MAAHGLDKRASAHILDHIDRDTFACLLNRATGIVAAPCAVMPKARRNPANPAVIDPSDGPPVLLLNNWVYLLIQRLEGFRNPSAMFGRHQRSASRQVATLVPRTFENLHFEQLKFPPNTIAKLKEWRLNTLEERWRDRPYYESFEDTKARLESAPTPTGQLSAFFMGFPDQQVDSLPRTRRLAEELDALSNMLLAQQLDGKGGSLEGYKSALLESPLVPREYWIEPLQGRDLRSMFQQANDWKTAWAITHIVIFYQQISLLALWDCEYCDDMFPGVRAIPLFLQLAPRLRPRPNGQFGTLRRINTRKSDVIDSPFSQLIDLIWCLLYRTLNGDWPERFPTDAEISQVLNNFQGNLADIRAGRPNLTISRFSALWPRDIRNKHGELIAPPSTLLAVAHIWNLIGPNKSLIPVDIYYMRAWQESRRVLGLMGSHGKMSNVSWPGYLDRGLDFPAPE